MLMDGRMIDHPDFENSTQSWRLGAVIFTLRTLGWPVETIEVQAHRRNRTESLRCTNLTRNTPRPGDEWGRGMKAIEIVCSSYEWWGDR
jgi:hypothetical protein